MLNKIFWLLVVASLVAAPFTPAPFTLGLVALNALTLFAYGADKLAALRQWQRIPEMSLLLFGLIGGWPGALAGRHLWRHKTQKQPFVLWFWLTVALNVLLAAAVLYGVYRLQANY